jgi:hypothetical protein
VVAVAISVIALGCGGGSSDSSSSLSRSAFLEQANQTCARQIEEQQTAMQAAFKKLAKEGGNKKKIKKGEEEVLLHVALPPVSALAHELRALVKRLRAPVGEKGKAEDMVIAFEEEVRKVEEDPAGVLTGSVGSFHRADRLAKDFKLEACAAI